MKVITSIILLLFLFSFLWAAQVSEPVSQYWSISHSGKKPVQFPVTMSGSSKYLNASSICDILRIGCNKEETGVYVISFPRLPVLLYPDGTFCLVGGEIVHLPVAPFEENGHLFLPEEFLLEIFRHHVPGLITIDEQEKSISYHPPTSDLLEIEGKQEGDDIVYRLLLAQPLTGQAEMTDSTELVLHIDGANLRKDSTVIREAENLGCKFSWSRNRERVLFHTDKPIGNVRLIGPDRENVLSLKITPRPEGYTPRTYDDRYIFEVIEDARDEWKINKVVIDPGHGGKDPGAIGITGIYEKDLTLRIGLMLRDILKKRTGIEVIMTRDDDTFIPLKERTTFANNVGGKLFISLHMNSAPSKRARGVETYILAPAETDRAKEVALKENSVIHYEDSQFDYVDLSEENYILLMMAQAQFSKESEEFAVLIQEKVSGRAGLKDRGVDQAGFFVLIGASMPAVLFEAGFISNAAEEKLFKSKDYCRKVADGLCDAIIEFIKQNGD